MISLNKKKVKKTIITRTNLRYSEIISCLLFIASMGLVVWGINIYRMTVIPSNFLFAVVIFGAIIGCPVIKFVLKPPYKTVWLFFISLAIGGGTLYFSFLYLNSKFTEEQEVTEILKIDRTGTLAKGRHDNCNSPYAVVRIKGIEKELIFSCDYEKSIRIYSEIQLAYSKGLFGFDIIKTKTLLK